MLYRISAWDSRRYCYNGRPFSSKTITGDSMSDEQNREREADGAADVKATLGIMAVVIYAAYYWLSGMPS